jgi:hypothetical protein
VDTDGHLVPHADEAIAAGLSELAEKAELADDDATLRELTRQG